MSAGMLRHTVVLGILTGCSLLSVTAWPGVDWAAGTLTVTVPAKEIVGGKCSSNALERIHSESASMRVDRGRIMRDVIPDAPTLSRLIQNGLLTVNVTINGNRATVSIPINGPRGLRAASRGVATLTPEPAVPQPEPVMRRSEPVAPVPVAGPEPLIPTPEHAPPAREPLPVIKQPEPVRYTGVIINASRLGIRPAMAPTVRDANGHEIMSPDTVDMAAAERTGFVSYARNLHDAKNGERAGRQPLVIDAQSVTRENGHTVITIPTAEAATIRSDTNLLNAFRTCKVIIVTN